MSLAIVIPTYNEAENISLLLDELLEQTSAHIIIVDDTSPDGTGELAKQKQSERITVITRPNKNGLGSAYREGFDYALKQGFMVIGQMDADFSHNPAAVNELVAQVQPNTLVLGSRYIKGGGIQGWNLWRHFCSRSAMAAARMILKLKTKDVTTGFRFWSADLLAAVLGQQIASTGYAFQEECIFYAEHLEATIIERPILFTDREKGKSKLGYRDVLEFFGVLMKLKRESRE